MSVLILLEWALSVPQIKKKMCFFMEPFIRTLCVPNNSWTKLDLPPFRAQVSEGRGPGALQEGGSGDRAPQGNCRHEARRSAECLPSQSPMERA